MIIFPAIDIQRSGTRREDLLYESKTYSQIMLLRRMVGLLNSEQKQNASDATMKVLETVGKSKNNSLYLEHLNSPNNSKQKYLVKYKKNIKKEKKCEKKGH